MMPDCDFVRSGIVNVNTGRLGNAGVNQDVWSSRAGEFVSDTSAKAYYLTFNASGVNPSNLSVRANGRSLRCLFFGGGADLSPKPPRMTKGASIVFMLFLLFCEFSNSITKKCCNFYNTLL